jgi:hypothetical protein
VNKALDVIPIFLNDVLTQSENVKRHSRSRIPVVWGWLRLLLAVGDPKLIEGSEHGKNLIEQGRGAFGPLTQPH